jgi:hypothetical protein
MLNIYAYDTLNTVVVLTYIAGATLADGTTVAADAPMDLSGFSSFKGQLRARPGTTLAKQRPDPWAVQLQVFDFDKDNGELRLYATEDECAKPQLADPEFPHGSTGMFDIFGVETGTTYEQLIYQGRWRFFHASTQPSGN